MDPILGMIVLWPVPWVPEGWRLCDGSLLQVNQNAALYSLIGNTYGGTAPTTFALPNLCSRIPVGAAAGGQIGMASGAATASVNAVGSTSLTIGIPNLPSHTHAATFTGAAGGTAPTSVNVAIPALSAVLATTSPASVNVPGPTVTLTAPAVATVKPYSAAPTDTTLKPFVATGSVTVPASAGTVNNANTGSGTPLPVSVNVPVTVSTLQPSLTLYYIIAVQGIYPQRP